MLVINAILMELNNILLIFSNIYFNNILLECNFESGSTWTI